MLLSCIFMTNTALEDQNLPSINELGNGDVDFDNYAVTCYICVNVSDNLICNQFAIDRPCKPGKRAKNNFNSKKMQQRRSTYSRRHIARIFIINAFITNLRVLHVITIAEYSCLSKDAL